MKKKITVLVAMMALMMFAAVPAFADTITIEEGDFTRTHDSTIDDSIGQFGGASVDFGDENESFQSVENSQIADIDIAGDGNEVEVEQSLEQSSFSPEVSTELDQAVAQAYAYWLFIPYYGWVLVYF